MGLVQLHGLVDMFSISYGFYACHYFYHAKHQAVNSLNHANILFVCTVNLVQYISARRVVKVQLTISQGTLARHDPLSGETLPS